MNDDKFKILAEKRVNNAIKQIRLVSNLSNKNSYSYEDNQVARIFSALQTELDTAKAKFKAGKQNNVSEFTL